MKAVFRTDGESLTKKSTKSIEKNEKMVYNILYSYLNIAVRVNIWQRKG